MFLQIPYQERFGVDAGQTPFSTFTPWLADRRNPFPSNHLSPHICAGHFLTYIEDTIFS